MTDNWGRNRAEPVAVGPPRNDSLMSFRNRPFREIARKLLGARPLGLQLVHPSDDVFRGLSSARRHASNRTGGRSGARRPSCM